MLYVKETLLLSFIVKACNMKEKEKYLHVYIFYFNQN